MKRFMEEVESQNNRIKELLQANETEQIAAVEEAEKEKNRLLKLVDESKQEKTSVMKKIIKEVECPVCLMVPRSDKIPVCKKRYQSVRMDTSHVKAAKSIF